MLDSCSMLDTTLPQQTVRYLNQVLGGESVRVAPNGKAAQLPYFLQDGYEVLPGELLGQEQALVDDGLGRQAGDVEMAARVDAALADEPGAEPGPEDVARRAQREEPAELDRRQAVGALQHDRCRRHEAEKAVVAAHLDAEDGEVGAVAGDDGERAEDRAQRNRTFAAARVGFRQRGDDESENRRRDGRHDDEAGLPAEMRLQHAARRDVQGKVRLDIDTGSASGKIVAELEDVSKSFGERAIVRERDAITVLGAEWARLTQPSRIQALTQKHLDLSDNPAVEMSSLTDLPAKVQPAPEETFSKEKLAYMHLQ